MNSPGTPPDALAEAALLLPAQAHLFYEYTAQTEARRTQHLRAGRLAPPQVQTHTTSYSGASAYVRQGTATGHSATADLTPSALRRAVQGAQQLHIQPPQPRNATTAALPLEPAWAHALAAVSDAAFGWEVRVTSTDVQVQSVARQTAVWTPTPTGLHTARQARIRLGVTLRVKGRTVQGQAIAPFTDNETLPATLAREAVADAVQRAGARRVTGGDMPVVFAPGWGGLWLHELIGHALEADHWSPHVLPLGTPIGTALLNVYDDATLPNGRASFPFDDEGTPAQRTPLIIDGLLQHLLTDTHFAAQLDRPRTGNGRRQDYRYSPLPRSTNLCLMPGPHQPADLQAAVEKGLLVTHLRHGQVYPRRGTFTLDVTAGFHLEKGRLTHPIAPVRLSGRIPDALHRIAGVGTDFQQDTAHGTCKKAGQTVPVSVGQPTVLFDAMTVEPV